MITNYCVESCRTINVQGKPHSLTVYCIPGLGSISNSATRQSNFSSTLLPIISPFFRTETHSHFKEQPLFFEAQQTLLQFRKSLLHHVVISITTTYCIHFLSIWHAIFILYSSFDLYATTAHLISSCFRVVPFICVVQLSISFLAHFP